MVLTNQTTRIMEKIEDYINKGMTDKSEIFTKVCKDLDVPRPTVRRAARDLRMKLARYTEILQVAPSGRPRDK